ncbi:CFC_HP_G0103050.mRNA.1.CDS.1 [Saccharomyces cerevisiae]|nr:CFC_HP_G0103050.mRNA.1.CDS.1 [Saccharomyces cerevisiae]CAI6907671.1 CFC_HP_G0103050.mRNA.1.CDS.1 [Saccharomyces cerevisiae]
MTRLGILKSNFRYQLRKMAQSRGDQNGSATVSKSVVMTMARQMMIFHIRGANQSTDPLKRIVLKL